MVEAVWCGVCACAGLIQHLCPCILCSPFSNIALALQSPSGNHVEGPCLPVSRRERHKIQIKCVVVFILSLAIPSAPSCIWVTICQKPKNDTASCIRCSLLTVTRGLESAG